VDPAARASSSVSRRVDGEDVPNLGTPKWFQVVSTAERNDVADVGDARIGGSNSQGSSPRRESDAPHGSEPDLPRGFGGCRSQLALAASPTSWTTPTISPLSCWVAVNWLRATRQENERVPTFGFGRHYVDDRPFCVWRIGSPPTIELIHLTPTCASELGTSCAPRDLNPKPAD
jgi:hypothetical protein